MTPSVSMSPSMLVPAAMMDRDELPPTEGLRVSSAARASLLKIAIRWSLFHERHGIDARAVVMHFEVKVRGKATGWAAEHTDHGAGRHAILLGHPYIANVGVGGLVAVAMCDPNDRGARRIDTDLDDRTRARGTNLRACRRFDVHTAGR